MDVLDSGDGPLARWMQRYGVWLVEEHPELHFELGRPLSKMDVIELLRSGYQAADASRWVDSFQAIERISTHRPPTSPTRHFSRPAWTEHSMSS